MTPVRLRSNRTGHGKRGETRQGHLGLPTGSCRRGGKTECVGNDPRAAGRRRKRHRSKDRTVIDHVVRPTQLEATQ
ncbi:hypothetical protein NDU88_009407 [Pleurodeles waltl]|uniref:Uncharacterized protein n=1 Tax=Pleurodeles waltl TaxID=8319 RepID=A0AAV7QV32_PLEWA|nr:hypothetical protein NDU88_009407 [Pleurodeles waltl]